MQVNIIQTVLVVRKKQTQFFEGVGWLVGVVG